MFDDRFKSKKQALRHKKHRRDDRPKGRIHNGDDHSERRNVKEQLKGWRREAA